MSDCKLTKTWRVNIPDHPYPYRVNGLTEIKSPTGRRLFVALAESITPIVNIPCRNTLTRMVLHDAIVARTPGPLRINNPAVYGNAANQRKQIIRIAESIVFEELP